jgi:predicted small secreted protein
MTIIDNKMKKEPKMLRLAIFLTAVLALAACEATKGLGRDLQNLGQALDDAI